MVSEKLTFQHKDLLYGKLKAIDTVIAEYSFPNLYLFRDSHRYEVIFDREIFVRGISYDGYTYLMPTGNIREIDRDYLRDIAAGVDFLFPIPEEWLASLGKDSFAFSSKRGEMDYLYTVEKMGTYRGRKLHKKRNLLKQFMTSYSHEAKPLTLDRMEDALLILDAWRDDSGGDVNQTDYSACLEALKLYDELILCGGIYYADHEPAGFVVGEELNESTFVLHFAKARKKFKGIYQYIYNTFARVLPPKYEYLNFEQDLDKDALRVAKSSYSPDFMVKKIRVSLKKSA